ncbi:PTS sugar transporter subunit IIA [Homoserinimonas sp. A520]
MVLPPLTEAGVVLNAEAEDWRAAVRVAGHALAAMGSARDGYAEEMIRMIDEHGPYVVIAPGLALAHARPGPDVLADGLAVVTLKDPVPFGHPHNDPVRVVLGLAILRVETHLASVAAIANIFNDSDAVNAIAAATTADEVLEIMGAGR